MKKKTPRNTRKNYYYIMRANRKEADEVKLIAKMHKMTVWDYLYQCHLEHCFKKEEE